MAAECVHVAVGVLYNEQGRVLITRRPENTHQGGLWEFPGGKVETGEDVGAALCRELREELGVTVLAARPFVKVSHRYPDKEVLLDVWRVEHYEGEPRGLEGQPVDWLAPAALRERSFPLANVPIIDAIVEIA